MSSTATQPSKRSPVSQHPLTNTEKEDVVFSQFSTLSAPDTSEAAVETRRDLSSDRSETMFLHVAVAADTSQSSLCTLTDAHRSPHASIVTSRVVPSNASVNSLGVCCRGTTASAGPIPHSLTGSNQSLNEAGGSSRKSSLEERLSKIWSTSTDSNADCEGENCEGIDRKCRKCGKIVSMPKSEENKATSKASQGLRGVISRDSSQTESFRRGIQQQHPVVLPAGRQHHLQATNEHKQKNSNNYSTLLSTCSRNIKKRGSRRQSVDVIYAREPTEPIIDKIKATRRLSRQTDVSSIELMTLNEGNEQEDMPGKGPTCPVTTYFDNHPPMATLRVQGENIQLSHSQLSPGGTRIHHLSASNSTESCPRAPWNSLETNISTSQDIEEKAIINEMGGHPARQNFNIGPHSSLDPELDTDHEGEGTEQGERNSDKDADRNTGGARRRRFSTKMPDQQARSTWPEREHQDWSAEVVVLVTLLVYIACKVLNFLDSLAPRRPGNRR